MDTNALSPSEIAKLRDMLDRAEIAQVVNDYFHAMDSRNLGLLKKVFVADSVYEVTMIGFPMARLEGYEAVTTAIANVTMFRTSHHGVRNMAITIDGDRADVNIFAMDALHDQRAFEGDVTAANRVIQHGLRYIDRFERREEGWRIVDRQLHCLWQIVSPNPMFAPVLPPW